MPISTPFHPDHRIFLLIAEKLNISKAAETLGVGQSGLSKAIHRLESDYGAALFARRNQGVELTREGQKLLRALKQCDSVWQLCFQTSESTREFEGRFTVGGHPSVLSVYLPSRLNTLLKAHPKLEFEIKLATSIETTRQVAALKLDFGLVVNYVKAADLVARKISTDFLALWKRAESSPQWICYSPEMIDIGKLLRKIDRKRLVSIPDYQIIYEMMLHGDCEGLLPNSLIRDKTIEQSGKKLREVDVSLVCHRDNARLAAYQAIASVLVPKS